MIKVCSNCGAKVNFKSFYKQMLKDRRTYTCIQCNTIHKVTISSMIPNLIIYITPLIYFIGECKLYLVSAVWILFSSLLVEPFILKYEEERK